MYFFQIHVNVKKERQNNRKIDREREREGDTDRQRYSLCCPKQHYKQSRKKKLLPKLSMYLSIYKTSYLSIYHYCCTHTHLNNFGLKFPNNPGQMVASNG